MAQTWRIVTYNTWKCDGLYRERLNWMGQALADLSPDIVCLQEAFDCPSGSADTVGHLASVLGMQSEVLAAREKTRRFEGKEQLSKSNLAILSNRPMTRQNNVKLADHDEDQDRWAMQVILSATLGTSLRVVNTHLSHLRGKKGDTLRRIQAQQLHAELNTASHETVVFCGDLNDEWESPNLSALHKRDWLKPDHEQEGATFLGAREDGTCAQRRIDAVQVTTGSKRSASVRRRFPALNTSVGPNREYPSDHAAVVIDLEFRSQDEEGA